MDIMNCTKDEQDDRELSEVNRRFKYATRIQLIVPDTRHIADVRPVLPASTHVHAGMAQSIYSLGSYLGTQQFLGLGDMRKTTGVPWAFGNYGPISCRHFGAS